MYDLIFLDNFKALDSLSEPLKTKNYLIAREFRNEQEIADLREKLKNSKLNLKICLLITKPDNKLPHKLKDKVDFIAVSGGTPQMNNFAVSTKGVDFLLSSCGEKLSFDKALARIAAENKVKIGILFSDFLNCYGTKRAKLFRNYLMTTKLLKRFKQVPLIFSGASNLNQLRSARDLLSFASFLNFSREEIIKSVKNFW